MPTSDWAMDSRHGRTPQIFSNVQLTHKIPCRNATANYGWPREDSPAISDPLTPLKWPRDSSGHGSAAKTCGLAGIDTQISKSCQTHREIRWPNFFDCFYKDATMIPVLSPIVVRALCGKWALVTVSFDERPGSESASLWFPHDMAT